MVFACIDEHESYSFYCSNSSDYNVEFFRKFMLVMNALDNRGIVTCPSLTLFAVMDWPQTQMRRILTLFVSPAARNHVNRMCLAADIPLIESGTAGYLGQVSVIKKVTHWSHGYTKSRSFNVVTSKIIHM